MEGEVVVDEGLDEPVAVIVVGVAAQAQALPPGRGGRLAHIAVEKLMVERLAGETVQAPPFSALPALSDLVEEHFNQPSLLAGIDFQRLSRIGSGSAPLSAFRLAAEILDRLA